jgi:hypothetical protein
LEIGSQVYEGKHAVGDTVRGIYVGRSDIHFVGTVTQFHCGTYTYDILYTHNSEHWLELAVSAQQIFAIEVSVSATCRNPFFFISISLLIPPCF